MEIKHLVVGAAAAASLFAHPATAASVVGATRIELTSAIPTWIQLDEIEAIEFGTLENVAASANGGLASATSSGFGTAPAGAIDGLIGPLGWHSGSSSGAERLTISFAAANLISLKVFGQIDSFAGRNEFNYSIFNGDNLLLASGVLDATTASGAIVTFDDPPITGGIPEPSTWALTILGFGAAGAMLRRRTFVAI